MGEQVTNEIISSPDEYYETPLYIPEQLRGKLGMFIYPEFSALLEDEGYTTFPINGIWGTLLNTGRGSYTSGHLHNRIMQESQTPLYEVDIQRIQESVAHYPKNIRRTYYSPRLLREQSRAKQFVVVDELALAIEDGCLLRGAPGIGLGRIEVLTNLVNKRVIELLASDNS